jgi:hypothetical protein
MKITLNILVFIGIGLALFLAALTFEMTNPEYHHDPGLFLYDQGNAQGKIRAEILEQLELFKRGYTNRDTLILESYMNQLFSNENILILGTMPGEIFSGYDAAKDLVASDWLYWGDVNMLVESANISVQDSVAWFSMIGNVEFDFSRLLNLPLRISGVMVLVEQDWKFQQLQFQFDLNTMWVLYLIIVLSLLLALSFIRLVVVVFRTLGWKSR